MPGSARWDPPSQPQAQIIWKLFYLVAFIGGLFGDGHRSRSCCCFATASSISSSSAWPRGNDGEGLCKVGICMGPPPKFPRRGLCCGTPVTRGAEGSGWLSWVVVPVMAPGCLSSSGRRGRVAGDLGVLPLLLRGLRKRRFPPGWGAAGWKSEAKKRSGKGESAAPGPCLHLDLLHPKGKPFPGSRGDPGGWVLARREPGIL